MDPCLRWSSGSSVFRQSLCLSVFVCAMWLFDVLVLLLLVLLCGLLWMGWQFKDLYRKAQSSGSPICRTEVVFRQCNLMQPRCQQRALCAVEFKQSGTRCAFYMRPHSRVLHKEACQYLQGPELKNSIYVRYAFSVGDCYPWVSFWKKACPALSCHLHWADNQGFRRQHHQGTS